MRGTVAIRCLGVVLGALLLLGPTATVAVGAQAATSPGSVAPGPTATYIDALFRLFLGRPATAADVAAWSPAVHDDARHGLTALLATSDEWAGRRIDDLYRDVFGRPADAAGRAHWVDQIRRGLRLEDVAARFYGSEEYWARVGRSNGGYVDALYRTVLDREPDAGGRSRWVDHLASGRLDRIAVAAHFFGSVESRRSRVQARYQEVLGRAADPGGLAHWTNLLSHLGDVALAAQLAASPEFHRKATGLLPAAVRIAPVGPGTSYPLSASWRPGCPVQPRDLVALEFRHWSYTGELRDGVLIVNRSVAAPVASVIRAMYGTGFPLAGARPVDDFGGDDDRSMAADNSSAFNCRSVGGTTTWSQHAYGTAIDLNPVRNPYVRSGQVDPPAGAAWTDRSDVRPGMLVEGGSVVVAFDRLGWGWGGRWSSAQDHQHFSTNGR